MISVPVSHLYPPTLGITSFISWKVPSDFQLFGPCCISFYQIHFINFNNFFWATNLWTVLQRISLNKLINFCIGFLFMPISFDMMGIRYFKVQASNTHNIDKGGICTISKKSVITYVFWSSVIVSTTMKMKVFLISHSLTDYHHTLHTVLNP